MMKRIFDTLKDAALLWDVLDGLHLPAFSVKDDLTISDCNATARSRLQFSKEELHGRPVFEIVRVPAALQGGLFMKGAVTLEGHCMRRNREAFPARITLVKHADGHVLVVEDLSEFLKTEKRAAHRRKEMVTFNELSKVLSRASRLEEITKGVLHTLVHTMSFDAAWIYLIDEATGKLHPVAFQVTDDAPLQTPLAGRLCENFIERVFRSGKSLLVRDAQDDPRVLPADPEASGLNSIAGVPLIVKSLGDLKGRVVGVLAVADRMSDYFSSLDMQFLSAVGHQLGVAIENARLIAGLKEKVNEIRLINEISSVVNSSLSIGHIFRLVFSEMKQVIDFDRASVTLLHPDQEMLNIFAIDTDRPTRLTKGVMAPLHETSAGWVTVHQKPWINQDLDAKVRFRYDAVLRDEGIRSTISVPLFKDRPLGALNLDSTLPGNYTQKDLEILLPVAKHLSIALENALLFEEISREKREWEKTFDAITDMVWIEDMKGKILRVNRAVIEKSGKAELSLIHKKGRELFRTLRIAEGDVPSPEAIGHRRQQFRELEGAGGSICYFWSYPLLNSEGNIYGVVNYLRDVTEQKKLEQRLIMADKLASLGILVAGVAHEINNPLGIIAGYSEALLDRAKDPSLRAVDAFEDFPEYLLTINNEIFRCKDTLKTLLDFARPSAGTFREIDINGLIKEVILLVRHGVRTHDHRIELDLQREIPETMADPGAMRQVLVNIIMNSFFFMDRKGRIVIRTSHEAGEKGQGHIRITITDNGRGISRDHIGKIFDPFFSTKAVGEGTGLGLSISHRIVTEHGGTIDVESASGKGATFIIRLPVSKKREGSRDG